MKKWMKYLTGASVAFALLFSMEVLAKEKKEGPEKKPEARAARPLSPGERFKKFDLNKDGKITLDEAKKSGLLKALRPRLAVRRPAGPQSEERIKEMTPESRRRMMQRMREMPPEHRREMMQRMRERWQAMPQERREQVRGRLREFGYAARGELRERMRAIPPEKREELARKFRELPPEERREKIRGYLKEVGTKYARAKFLESLSPRQRELYLQMVGPEQRERLKKYFRELEKRKGREEFFRSLSPEQRRWLLQSVPPEKAGGLQRILRALPPRPERPALRGPVRPRGRLEPFQTPRARRPTTPGLVQPEGPRPPARQMRPSRRLRRGSGQMQPRWRGPRAGVEKERIPSVPARPEREIRAEEPSLKLFRRPLASPEPLPFASGEGLLEDWDIFENWETLESLGAFGE